MRKQFQSLPQFELGSNRSAETRHEIAKRSRHLLKLGLTFLLVWSLYARIWSQSSMPRVGKPSIPLKAIPSRLHDFQACSIRDLLTDTHRDFLSTAHPIQPSEFVSRRDRLAQALVADGIDAFAVEPGYTFQFYANVRCHHSSPSCILATVSLHLLSVTFRSHKRIGNHGSLKSVLSL